MTVPLSLVVATPTFASTDVNLNYSLENSPIVCSANNSEIAVYSTQRTLYYSTDGINWFAGRINPGSFSARKIIWTGTQFVAVGDNGCYTSIDGKQWHRTSSTAMYSIEYNGTTYVSTQNSGIYSSTNLVNWTLRYAVTLGGTNNGNFLWTGQNFILVLPGSSVVSRSTDGITWSASISGSGKSGFLTNNSSKFVYGEGNFAFASTDGNSWTTNSIPTVGGSSTIRDGYWDEANNIFVACGSSGSSAGIFTSTNGLNWANTSILNTSQSGFGLVTMKKFGNNNSVAAGQPFSIYLNHYTDPVTVSSVYGFVPELFSGGTSNNIFIGLTDTYTSNTYYYSSNKGLTWSTKKFPAPVNFQTKWKDAIWTGTQFVAVGGNRVASSTDGLTWNDTTFTASTTFIARKIAYSGSRYVIVGGALSSGFLQRTTTYFYSTDLVTWSSGTLPSSELWGCLNWNGTQFYAIGGGSESFYSFSNYPTNQAASSTDGITWTARTMSSTTSYNSLQWNGTRYCVARYNSGACYSTDGITWNNSTTFSFNQIRNMHWNGTYFIATGDSQRTYYSTDGINFGSSAFVQSYPSAGPTSSMVTVDNITYAFMPSDRRSLLVATSSSKLFRGSNFDFSIYQNFSNTYINSISTKESSNTLMFVGTERVATRTRSPIIGEFTENNDVRLYTQLPIKQMWSGIANNGTTLVASGSNASLLNFAYSTDGGKSWLPSYPAISTYVGEDVLWNGNYFLATNPSTTFNTIYYSSDGIFWSPTSGAISYTKKLAFNGNVSVVTGSGTSYGYSTDGINWTTASGNINNDKIIAYNPGSGRFISILSNGSLATNVSEYSTNGINWFQFFSPNLPAKKWSAITTNGTILCAVPFTDNVSAITTDGSSWTTGTLPKVANWTSVCFNGNVFCAVANFETNSNIPTRVAATSTDGITWTERTLPVASFWSKVSNFGNKLIAISGSTNRSNNFVAHSTDDGSTWEMYGLIDANTVIETGSQGLNDIIYVPSSNSHIAVGNLGCVAISTDEKGFYNINTGVTANLYSIAYNQSNLYIVTGQTNTLLRSTDGLTWTNNTASNPLLNDIVKIVWDDSSSRFYAMSHSGFFTASTGFGQLASTTDGLTWSILTSPGPTNNGIANNGSEILLTTHLTSIKSTDSGNTWTSYVTNGGTTTDNYFNDILKYLNDRYYLTANVFNSYQTSTDGLNWQKYGISKLSETGVTKKIVKNNNKDYYFSSSNVNSFTFTSNSYIWQTFTIPESLLIGSAASNNETIVISSSSANNTTTYASTDGANWTKGTLPTLAFGDRTWGPMAYGDGKFVILGTRSGSSGAYSTNGVSWTEMTIPGTNYPWSDVVYFKGIFSAIAGGSFSSNYSGWSTNGISWTQTTMPQSTTWKKMIAGNDLLFALATSSVVKSTDGKIWDYASNLTFQVYDGASNGTNFLFIPSSGLTASLTTDGVNWTTTLLPGNLLWDSVYWDGSKYVLVSSSAYYNTISTSSDGTIWTPLITQDRYYTSLLYDSKYIIGGYRLVVNDTIYKYLTGNLNFNDVTYG